MNLKKITFYGLLLIAIAAIGGYLYLKNAGEAVSKINKDNVELDSSAVQVETTQGNIIVDIAELNGNFNSIDERSELFFKFGGITGTKGEFKKFKANFNKSDSIMSISVEIDPASAFTNNSMRDEHIKAEDFFNVSNFPKISFSSTDVSLGDSTYVAKGKLNFLGNETDQIILFNYKGKVKDSEVHIFEGSFPFKQSVMKSGQAPQELEVSFYIEMD